MSSSLQQQQQSAVRFNESVTVQHADGSIGPTTQLNTVNPSAAGASSSTLSMNASSTGSGGDSTKKKPGIPGMGAAARLAIGLKKAGRAAAARVAAKKAMIANSSLLSPSPSRGDFNELGGGSASPTSRGGGTLLAGGNRSMIAGQHNMSFISNLSTGSKMGMLPVDEITGIPRSVSETDSLAGDNTNNNNLGGSAGLRHIQNTGEARALQERLIQPPHLQFLKSKKPSPARADGATTSAQQRSLNHSQTSSSGRSPKTTGGSAGGGGFLSWAQSDHPSASRKYSPVRVAREQQERQKAAELRHREKQLMMQYGVSGGGGSGSQSALRNNASMRLPGSMNSVQLAQQLQQLQQVSPSSAGTTTNNANVSGASLPLVAAGRRPTSKQTSRSNSPSVSKLQVVKSPGQSAILPKDFANFSFANNNTIAQQQQLQKQRGTSTATTSGKKGATPPLAPASPATNSVPNSSSMISLNKKRSSVGGGTASSSAATSKEPSPSIQIPQHLISSSSGNNNKTSSTQKENWVPIEIDPAVYNAMSPEEQWAYYYSVVGKQQQQSQSQPPSQQQQQKPSTTTTSAVGKEASLGSDNENASFGSGGAPLQVEATMAQYPSFRRSETSKPPDEEKQQDNTADDTTSAYDKRIRDRHDKTQVLGESITGKRDSAEDEQEDKEDEKEKEKERLINYYLDYASGKIEATGLTQDNINDLHVGAQYYQERETENEKKKNAAGAVEGDATKENREEQQQEADSSDKKDDKNDKEEQGEAAATDDNNNNNNTTTIDDLAAQYPREDLITFYLQYAQGQIDTSTLTEEQIQLLHVGAKYYNEQIEKQQQEELAERSNRVAVAKRRQSSALTGGGAGQDDVFGASGDEEFEDDEEEEGEEYFIDEDGNVKSFKLPEQHEMGVQTDPVKIVPTGIEIAKAREFLSKKKIQELRKIADSGNVVHLGELAGPKVAPVNAPAVVDSLVTAEEKKQLLKSKGAQSILFHNVLSSTNNKNNNNDSSSGQQQQQSGLVGTLLEEQQQQIFGKTLGSKNHHHKKPDSRHKAIPGVGEATARDKIDSWFSTVAGEKYVKGQSLKIHHSDPHSSISNNNSFTDQQTGLLGVAATATTTANAADNKNGNHQQPTLIRRASFASSNNRSGSNYSTNDSESAMAAQNLVPQEIGKFRKSAVDESSVSWRAVASQIAAARRMKQQQQQQSQ